MTHVHSCRVKVHRVAQILHHGSPEHAKTVILLLKLRLRLQQLTHSRTLLILHLADLHSQPLVLLPHFVQFASEFVAILIMPRLLLEKLAIVEKVACSLSAYCSSKSTLILSPASTAACLDNS